ncbi:hypothetical protein [Chachezhania antarctica]|uniref:hypothetical protein n=1 Tax=Chachezhania antarctica TaxID=2340860 RepID=UPI000EACE20D|nr:hypothetical protein [Chachezhania antarctica]|tara:strand:- start:1909 stop:2565 length:657 start_codon:yes stop_codon:yes gene_type:complete
MLDVIKSNIGLFQLATSVVVILVWLVYLNIFLKDFRQQRRSSLLITRGGADDITARCLVSNMGAQPAYLLDVLACFDTPDGPVFASVVDRSELRQDQVDLPSELTGQGPIASGGFVDIGSFRDVAGRALDGSGFRVNDCDDLKLVAVATTNQAQRLVAAVRDFGFDHDGDTVHVAPRAVEARQIRSRRDQRRIRKVLSALQTRRSDAAQFSKEIISAL